MQTEITIPADIITAAQQIAQKLGLSPDELFANAISDFIQKHGDVNITAELDKIYADDDSTLDPVLATLQLKSLPKEEW